MGNERTAGDRRLMAALGKLHEERSLSLGAFLLSVVIALINAYYAARGPEMVVQPLEQVLLYRNAEGSAAVLSIATDVTMINSASGEHGDVLLDASLRPGPGRAFSYQSIIQPIFTNEKVPCDIGARCVKLEGLAVIERADDLLDIPGGTARARYLSFAATAWNCEGKKSVCAGFGDFEAATRALEAAGSDFEVDLRFHGDGERQLRCRTEPIDYNYLRKYGWVNIPCQTAFVSGGSLL